MTTLVLGASGYIGTHLVPRLVADGHKVRAGSRRLDVLQGREWGEDVELVSMDVLDPQSLEVAFAGVETLYYLVHSMGSGGDFAARDRTAAINVREAAAAAGVTRIIYLGGLQQKGTTSRHLASRGEVGDLLRRGTVHVIEIRAGIIVGPGSAGFEILRDLVNHLPVMIAPRWVASKTQPIALEDLLLYLMGLAGVDLDSNLLLDAAGPDILTYGDLITQFAAVVNKRRLLIPVPVISPRLSSYWLDLVTAVPASVGRPLVEGLKHDLVADDRELRRLLPIHLQTYKDSVRAALRLEREAPLPAHWSEGALAFRGYDPSVSFYSKGETSSFDAEVPAEELWAVLSTIGGRRGYFYADWLWEVRGAMDRLVGGPGMRRGRRHASHIRVGDVIDFWRVAALEPGKRLTLVAEMKLPGSAVLELEVVPLEPTRSRLLTTARFHPAGAFGLAYWYSVMPFHGRIFSGMPRAIVAEAERRHGSSRQR